MRFAFLPGGLDPDDLVRQQGPTPSPPSSPKTRALFDVLWQREEQEQDLSTPEQRAAFETRLKAMVGKIGDATVKAHYERELRETLWALNRTRGARDRPRRGPAPWAGRRPAQQYYARLARARARPARPQAAAGRRRQRTRQATPSTELSQRAESLPPREALILKTLLNHPWLIEEHSEEIAAHNLASRPSPALRDAILALQALENDLDSTVIRTQLSVSGLDKVIDLVERSVTHRSDRFAEPDAPRAEVEVGWRHALALHERQVGLQKSLEAAVQAYHRDGSEDALARICEIQGLLAKSSQLPLFAEPVE